MSLLSLKDFLKKYSSLPIAKGTCGAERVNFEFVDKYIDIYQLMSFNVYILLFLPYMLFL
jgi:hypothetical protein